MTLNERKIYLLSWLNVVINLFLSKSDELGMYAIQNGIIERLLKVLDDKHFIDEMEAYSPGSLSIFVAISGCSFEEEKSRWQKADAIRIFTNVLNDHPEYSINLYSTMVAIAFDKDLEKLIEMNDIIDRLVALTVEGVKNQNKMPWVSEVIDQIDQTQHEVKILILKTRNRPF